MKFVVDKMLGRLAKWLCILGYDCVYFRQDKKIELVYISLRGDRIILTRNTRLAKKKNLKLLFIKSELIKDQLEQVIKHFNLRIDQSEILTRCLICNEKLKIVKKELIKDKIPAYVYDTQEEFAKCLVCNKIYWKGTHWDNIIEDLQKIQKKTNSCRRRKGDGSI